jgi:transcriptional regulator with XRE-family HTH domain
MNLGDKIRLLRQDRHWSQSRLSKESGIPQPTIWRLERGSIRSPKLPMLERLAEVFDISLDELAEKGRQMSLDDLKEDPVAMVLLRGYEALSPSAREQLSDYAQWLVEQDRKRREKI